jgi:hypothetical protein
MGDKVEFWVTISCVITLVTFWIFYWILLSKWITYLSNKFICVLTKNDTEQSSKLLLLLMLLFAILSLPITLLHSYYVTGDPMGLVRNENLFALLRHMTLSDSAFMRNITRIVSIYQFVIPIFSCFIFVEIFSKESILKSNIWRLAGIIGMLSCILMQGYSGFRSRVILIPALIFILIFLYIVKNKKKLFKTFWIVYPLICILCLVIVTLIPILRDKGKTGKTETFTQRFNRIFFIDKTNVTTVAANVINPIDSGDTKNQTDIIKPVNEKKLNKFKLRNVSDYIAWSMVNFNQDEPFMGIKKQLWFVISIPIPKEFYKDKLKPTSIEREVFMKIHYGHSKGHPFGAVIYFSPFGEGYVSCGYIGGIISSIFWGILLGLLAKIIIVHYEFLSTRFDGEILMLSLYILIFISFRGLAPVLMRIISICAPIIFLFWFCYLIKIIFQRIKIRKQL